MPPSFPTTSSPPIFIATRFLCRQRRDQSCSFPGTKFCSSTLVNADDRKGFERERFYRSPQRISQCFTFCTFHPWLFYLLLSTLFSTPSTWCLLQERLFARGGEGCMLNKIREWKRFRFAAVLSSLSLLHCFFFSILYKQLEALIFRKILLRRVFHPRSISSKEVNETTYWTVHIILFILVNIDIFFIERKEEIPV